MSTIVKSIAGESGGITLCQPYSTDQFFTTYREDASATVIKVMGSNLMDGMRKGRTIKIKPGRDITTTVREQHYSEFVLYLVEITGNYLKDGIRKSVAFGTVLCRSYASFSLLIDEDAQKAYIDVVGDIGYYNPPTRIGETFYWLYDAALSGQFYTNLIEFLEGIDVGDGDPYHAYNPDDGGNGTRDSSSEDIDFPDLPDISAMASGFITVYKPSFAQLHDFGEYLWSNDFSMDNFKKIFADPWEGIIGLSIIPFDVPTSGSKNVKVGNATTSISMPVVGGQYVDVDCGSITISEFWGSYLDYTDTHIDIYLPYVGMRTLDTDLVMGKSINVKYRVDVISGSCVCLIKCGGSVMYSFSGNVSQQLPITASNFNQVMQGGIMLGITAVAGMASGGLAAPIAAGAITATASNISNMKTHTEKSGSVSGGVGIMGIQKPYVIIQRPNLIVATNQNSFIGYPSYATRQLSELTGYTEIEEIHLENINCTDDERKEIENLLKGGVIL